MKQMTLIEMDGFLKGKCIPSDLKVNETNAEYLVRKFGELESKLETALRECRSAGITIDNLEAKCAALAADNEKAMEAMRQADAAVKLAHEKFSALAAENAGLHARTPVAYSYRYAGCETCEGFQDWRWELSKEKPPEWMLETGKVTNLVELFELHETPSTDAFLAEVRAQGVEMFAQWCRGERDFTLIDEDVADAAAYGECVKRAEYFAAQVRKGGNQ
ncbi:hypothetical protein [Escherichia coli]|uniref:hypothetical protein n=1 Tax=Escherichia coli TaxID=562 RepID=UPI0019597179|nr:hypothetical protein [Escherichia coli]